MFISDQLSVLADIGKVISVNWNISNSHIGTVHHYFVCIKVLDDPDYNLDNLQ